MNKGTGALGVGGVIKKSVSVAEWLIAAIREGKYEVGDKLSSERALAEELGVSRTVVREALSSLQVAGLIEPRVGDGTYVVSTPPAEVRIDEVVSALEASGTLFEVWRIRRDLETVLTKLAVEAATEADLAAIEEALTGIRKAVEAGDPDGYLEANNEFHLAIADAGKNPFLGRALLPLLEITKHQLAKEVTADYISAHAADLLQKHRDILTALKARDATTTVEVLKAHFGKSEEVFLQDVVSTSNISQPRR
jgi:GntR family transcriptional repressor for pyruvate dehydrogenase complex